MAGRRLDKGGFVRLGEGLVFGDISPVAFRVYVGLEWFAGGKGECWPGQALLAERLHLSRRHVLRGLNELREKGWIRVTRGQSGNRYKLFPGGAAEHSGHMGSDSIGAVADHGGHSAGDSSEVKEPESMNQINEEEVGGEVTVGAGVGDVDWRLVMWLGLDEVTRGRLRFLRVVDDRLLVRFVSRVYEPGRDWLERTRGLYPGVEFLEVL